MIKKKYKSCIGCTAFQIFDYDEIIIKCNLELPIKYKISFTNDGMDEYAKPLQKCYHPNNEGEYNISEQLTIKDNMDEAQIIINKNSFNKCNINSLVLKNKIIGIFKEDYIYENDKEYLILLSDNKYKYKIINKLDVIC